jgi:protein-S-isoprenylcysteine O-methyltransferase Ste14
MHLYWFNLVHENLLQQHLPWVTVLSTRIYRGFRFDLLPAPAYHGSMDPYRINFIIVFSMLSLLRLYYRIKTGAIHDRVFNRTEGLAPVLIRWVMGVPLLASTGVYIFAPRAWGWMYLPPDALPKAVRILGIILGYTAVFIIWRVHRELGVNFSSSLVLRSGHRLVRTGPYRFVRHPMYSAYLLLFIGAGLISLSWLLGVSGVAVIVTLMTIRLIKEESLLLARFGKEYADYRRGTGMFIPLPPFLAYRRPSRK